MATVTEVQARTDWFQLQRCVLKECLCAMLLASLLLNSHCEGTEHPFDSLVNKQNEWGIGQGSESVTAVYSSNCNSRSWHYLAPLQQSLSIRYDMKIASTCNSWTELPRKRIFCIPDEFLRWQLCKPQKKIWEEYWSNCTMRKGNFSCLFLM